MNKLIRLVVLPLLLVTTIHFIGHAQQVGTANVKFGNPNDSRGGCQGKGICNMNSLGSAEGVDVNISVIPGEDHRTLTISFLIPEMEAKFKDYLYEYFLTSRGKPRSSYSFDEAFIFTDRELCAALGVEPGSVTITPSCSSDIQKLFDTQLILSYEIPNETTSGAEQQR